MRRLRRRSFWLAVAALAGTLAGGCVTVAVEARTYMLVLAGA